MIIIVEADWRWAGVGIDWLRYIKGFRLGFLAVHVVASRLDVFIEAYQEGQKRPPGKVTIHSTDK